MFIFAVNQSGKAVFCFPRAKLVPEAPVGQPQVVQCGKQVSGCEELLACACALCLLQRVPGHAPWSGIMGS